MVYFNSKLSSLEFSFIAVKYFAEEKRDLESNIINHQIRIRLCLFGRCFEKFWSRFKCARTLCELEWCKSWQFISTTVVQSLVPFSVTLDSAWAFQISHEKLRVQTVASSGNFNVLSLNRFKAVSGRASKVKSWISLDWCGAAECTFGRLWQFHRMSVSWDLVRRFSQLLECFSSQRCATISTFEEWHVTD